MRLARLWAAALALTLALPVAGALAAEPVTLTPDELERIKVKLIRAKPNPGTAAVVSFLAPGSAQANMGHVDRSLALWGGYLLGFLVLKALPLPAAQPGAPALSDVAIGTLLLGMASASSVDAYLLAYREREVYDVLLRELEEKAEADR